MKKKAEEESLRMPIVQICKFFNKSKQAYYKKVESKRKEKFKEEVVVKLVMEKRSILPKIGVRKLHHILKPDFKKLGFKIGRDKLFTILSKYSLLILKKRGYVRTTNSNHWYFRYTNLIKDLIIIQPNQVFVSDITYIRVQDRFMFLSLITDHFSRKIVGYKLHNDLSASGPIDALNMALKDVKKTDGLIHHSDRGIQYACNEYTDKLKNKNIKISMTEENHVYENAMAERVNGILKDEFFLNATFGSEDIAHRAVDEAVKHYNEVRPHYSIGLSTPAEKYALAA